jgi:hypothetical protein
MRLSGGFRKVLLHRLTLAPELGSITSPMFDFSSQAIEFIEFLSAFFVIVLSQSRMDARCAGH